MKIWRWVVVGAIALFTLTGISSAQSVDAFFGVNALTASQPAGVPSLGGGAFTAVGGDLLFWHNLGFYGEAAWRYKQTTYAGNPVRPLYYDFGAAWSPVKFLSGRAVPLIRAGLGVQSLRVYQPFYNCGAFTGCTNYTTSNHLAGHFAFGLKLFLTQHIFLMPEYNLYLIRNNVEYQTSHANMFGISIGYNLGQNNE